MSYGYPGEGSLDYACYPFGTSKLLFRGPRRDLSGPYCVALGGTETYGKFIEHPYPLLLERSLGQPVVNFGCQNAGPDVFLGDQSVLDCASAARVVIVQITRPQNISNRFYTVHPRRNDRFVGATPALRALYRDVDFTEYNFTSHMLQGLYRASPIRFEVLAQAIRETWVDRMTTLLRRIPAQKILLWLDDHPPARPGGPRPATGMPALVDHNLIKTLRPHVDVYHEHVISPAARAQGTAGMIFSPLEAPAAAGLPNRAAHYELADGLFPVLDGLF